MGTDIINFKKANCKNCYKCLRECPVKAISFKDGQAGIINENCLICGHCLTVCPQNAKRVRSDAEAVRALIASGKRVIASIAPSYIAQFECAGLCGLERLLRQLGFYAAFETSVGAAVIAAEYERLAAAHRTPVLITTSCPTIVRLVEKYYTESIKYLAKVVSPMTAHARMIKKEMGDVAVVFIGPCISKKDEAGWDNDAVDYVLTFDELQDWLDEAGVKTQPDDVPVCEKRHERINAAAFFPVGGGILKSMGQRMPDVYYTSVSGIDKCRGVLEELKRGSLHGCFIEMSACEESCVGGPCMTNNRVGLVEAVKRVSKYAQMGSEAAFCTDGIELERKFTAMPVENERPGERTIKEILAKMGKKNESDELNCGACGYTSCRQKAKAVFQGKAELNMCMPYMRERAEFISDNVIAFTPNAIVVLDSYLNIQALNQAAVEMFGTESVANLKGRYIGDITDSTQFEEATIRKQNILDRKAYIFKIDKYVEQSVIYVKDHDLVFGIFKDLTESNRQTERLKKVRTDTVETADRVIDKQMRIAQEIAMLLGESTAETKIALTKLKETMTAEEE